MKQTTGSLDLSMMPFHVREIPNDRDLNEMYRNSAKKIFKMFVQCRCDVGLSLRCEGKSVRVIETLLVPSRMFVSGNESRCVRTCCIFKFAAM